MTTQPATVQLTAEEFANLPQPANGTQQELVLGTIVTMPPPGFYHGQVCSRMDRKLGNFIDGHNLGWLTCNDAGVILSRDPDTVRGPDLAFWTHERMPTPPRQGYPTVAPDLVVEVLSPSDVFTRTHLKIQQYLEAGVRLVWILVPEDRSVAVFRAGHPASVLYNGTTLEGEDVLPGFTCPISDLFP